MAAARRRQQKRKGSIGHKAIFSSSSFRSCREATTTTKPGETYSPPFTLDAARPPNKRTLPESGGWKQWAAALLLEGEKEGGQIEKS